MRNFIVGVGSLIGVLFLFLGLKVPQQRDYSLQHLTPKNYQYKEVERCSNCKGEQNRFMLRAAGVEMSSRMPVLDKRGWLASIHARSQSHKDRVNTACAWCHAPTAEGATRNKEEAKPIPKGTWQGVTCGACHPGSVGRSKRISLVSNYTPGTDPTNSENYIFRNRKDGKAMNSQCRFCHHESHDLMVEAKQTMMNSGDLRCIDCHMAAYAVSNQHIERFHNFKVAANLPHSCSGGVETIVSCHDSMSQEWFEEKLPTVKGLRKEWSSLDIVEAAKQGKFDVVKAILVHDTEEVLSADKTGYTALHWAGMRENWDIFKLLLEYGAEVNIVGADGGTPVHWACHHDRPDMIKILLSKGGGVNIQNRWGRTPLHAAVRRGCREVAALLLEKGAKPDAVTNEGWTPLHVAYRSGHKDVIDLLLSKGLSKETKDTEGKTPPELYAERPTPVQVDTRIYDEYIGEYAVGGDFSFKVWKEDDELYFLDFAVDELYPIAEDVFSCKQEPWRVTFVRNEQGKVYKLEVEFIRRKVTGIKR